MDKETFAKWLRSKVSERGIKPSQLAAYLETTHVTVGNWLEGRYLPKPANISRIAKYFKIDPDYLLELAGYTPSRPVSNLDLLDPRLKLLIQRIAHLSPKAQETILTVITPIVEWEERAQR